MERLTVPTFELLGKTLDKTPADILAKAYRKLTLMVDTLNATGELAGQGPMETTDVESLTGNKLPCDTDAKRLVYRVYLATHGPCNLMEQAVKAKLATKTDPRYVGFQAVRNLARVLVSLTFGVERVVRGGKGKRLESKLSELPDFE